MFVCPKIVVLDTLSRGYTDQWVSSAKPITKTCLVLGRFWTNPTAIILHE